MGHIVPGTWRGEGLLQLSPVPQLAGAYLLAQSIHSAGPTFPSMALLLSLSQTKSGTGSEQVWADWLKLCSLCLVWLSLKSPAALLFTRARLRLHAPPCQWLAGKLTYGQGTCSTHPTKGPNQGLPLCSIFLPSSSLAGVQSPALLSRCGHLVTDGK